MEIGFADLHNHQFANLGFGGRLVWGSPVGAPAAAFGSCDHGPLGLRDVVGNAMRLAFLRRRPWHDVRGGPGFEGWPSWDTFTHQGVHEEWLRRAVDGGLRLMVMLAVNNEWVARKILRAPEASADDMTAVDAQLSAAHELARSIDARHGGPGRGWYRIVRSSEEARQVIADGKLAVVLGIEVDHLFGARAGTPPTADDVRAQLDHYFAQGVRHVFPLHFGDNAYGGGSFDNAMIRDVGARWPSARNPLVTLGAARVRTEDARTAGYEYRTGRRNVVGLTPLGTTLIRELMRRGMVFDLDHMSASSRRDALDLCETYGYPAVAGHAGFLELARGDRAHERQLRPDDLARLRELGGMVGVLVDQGGLADSREWQVDGRAPVPVTAGRTSNTLVQAYLYAADKMAGQPVGLGTDFNGFACLPGPRFGRGLPRRERRGQPAADRLQYPFQTLVDGQPMPRSIVGTREYDYNTDGLAHMGMLPDLVADFEAMGVTRAQLEPLARSAMGYVDLWSRAEAARP